ncbi:MAG: mechanosensitive ion channel family protein, partial [Candidatus Methanoperedens sp.]
MNFMASVKAAFLTFLIVFIAYINYFTNYFSQYSQDLTKILHSFIIILILYVANIFIGNLLMRQVREKRERYTLRKA